MTFFQPEAAKHETLMGDQRAKRSVQFIGIEPAGRSPEYVRDA